MNDMYIALSGAIAQERQLEVASNNLANVSTSGFKRDNLVNEAILPSENFAQIWQAQLDHLDKSEPLALNRDFPYVRSRETVTDLTPGSLVNTGNPFDLALEETNRNLKGRAFFALETPGGMMLTRSSHFTLGGADGQTLVHGPSGLPLQGKQAGAFNIESGELAVNEDGAIFDSEKNLGPLKVVTIANPSQLEKVGQGLFRYRGDPGELQELEPGKDYKVRQNTMEQSNVNVIDEMTRMIQIQRSYSAMAKAIHTANEARSRMTQFAMRQIL